VVRSPLTGVVLISEMTRAELMLFPMLTACFTAQLVAHWFKQPPIYDSLAEHGTWPKEVGGNSDR
jgi:CIC family chloride channel protein